MSINRLQRTALRAAAEPGRSAAEEVPMRGGVAVRTALLTIILVFGLGVGSCDQEAWRASFEWVALRPVQCRGNPWELEAPREASSIQFPIAELDAIEGFFSSRGVHIVEVGLISEEGGGVCLACFCPRGDVLIVKASQRDAWKLVSEFGFTYLFAEGHERWLSRLPVQCLDNPWVEGGAPDEEFAAFRSWASSVAATVTMGGFIYPAEPFGTCLACSCPRGDRLLVRAPTEGVEVVLRSYGFTRLF
jgi:hypothetical protein